VKDTTMLRARSDIRTGNAQRTASAATDTAPATPIRTEPRSTAATAQPDAAPSPAADARPDAAIAAAGAKTAPSPATARDSVQRFTVADGLKPARIRIGLGRRPRAHHTSLSLMD
jgi:hypothetical protein